MSFDTTLAKPVGRREPEPSAWLWHVFLFLRPRAFFRAFAGRRIRPWSSAVHGRTASARRWGGWNAYWVDVDTSEPDYELVFVEGAADSVVRLTAYESDGSLQLVGSSLRLE